MHITNIPLIVSSLCFLFPFYAAVETQNVWSAVGWGALTCTSTLLHITKQPYHIHGPGNCIPWLYSLDVTVLYAASARAVLDGWMGGPVGFTMAVVVVAYAMTMFYTGKRFVYDTHLDLSIVSHMSVHMLAAIGATAVLYLRALKNGLPDSQ
jgi:hypothetical protein